jgi:hypothetical protein
MTSYYRNRPLLPLAVAMPLRFKTLRPNQSARSWKL